jgi:hypothetical protein
LLLCLRGNCAQVLSRVSILGRGFFSFGVSAIVNRKPQGLSIQEWLIVRDSITAVTAIAISPSRMGNVRAFNGEWLPACQWFNVRLS